MDIVTEELVLHSEQENKRVHIWLRKFLRLQLDKESIFIAMNFILNCLSKDRQECHFTCLRYKKLEKLKYGKRFPFLTLELQICLI